MNIIKEWNENNYPWKIINLNEAKSNVFYKLSLLLIILISVSFLSIYGLRTYYYDFYRDIIETTHICEPSTNLTCEGVKCSDVNVDCECIEIDELNELLEDVCPDTINVNIENV